MYFIGYKLFPARQDAMDTLATQQREYFIETKIPADSHLVGKTILEANLRNLQGVYLFEIVRENKVLSPVSPKEVLFSQDTLYFAGDTENIADLIRNNNGLILPESDGEMWQNEGDLVEVVVPANSELIGRTLKSLDFRENYDAAVVAVHRNGERLHGKIGEVTLRAGDLLLVKAGSRFEVIIRQNHSLYSVSVLNHPQKPTKLQKRVFLGMFLVVLGLLIFGKVSLFFGLLIITTTMVLSGMLTTGEIKRQFDIGLMIILAASLTFSKALIDTGVAEMLARGIIAIFSGGGSVGLMIGLFVITLVLTSFITHVATVSIVFPIAYALCHGLHIDPVPFYVAIAFAASASFHSPFSYQTNLMVLGPGNYRFKDFLKAGLPITGIYSVICIVFIIFYYQL
jgi:di/tricarboxylate transporter